ncbi:hypothetical protein BKA70DRAFT_1248425 [Coprinopsis sp. MPI-PUGE-AT-0042]|nr:hypothetical protein BKA70DRAFT_1248425 [Coprinopsis sp. MPI-PUGE-AT-0042]
MSYTLDGYLIGRNPQSLSLIPQDISRDSGLGPIRPKRRQVKNACTRCQKACKKCDDARPCLRCVRYGCTDGCISSVRKERKKGFKRGPYKKRDAEAQLLLSRVSSLRTTRNTTTDPQHAGNTSMSAFTSSPLTDSPPPTWDTASYQPAHPQPAYQAIADTPPAYPPNQYLTAAQQQVDQYSEQFYLPPQPQVPPHSTPYLISPAVTQCTQHYVAAIGHKPTVTDAMSYHAHHQYHT